MKRPKGITLDEFRDDQMRSRRYRKAVWEAQWDEWHQTVPMVLKLLRGTLQRDLARKAGMKQPSVARAVAMGCSLKTLNRLARACGKRVIVSIGDANELK